MVALPRSTTPSIPTATPEVSWDAYPPPPPPKLRLMCSYGGHIIPRPHDKTLCYVGGDTRISLIDRRITLSDLRLRLSKIFLQNHPFLLKYQLPNEDLDSLISVTTDEDLEIMVDEHDSISNSVGLPGRLRLFLFPKSEDLFSGALNGQADRGLDVHSVLDSMMLETSSSHGSTSSSDLPPIHGPPPVVIHDHDDQRSGRGGYGKVQQIQLPVHQNQTSAFDLPSPNSVSSEGSTRQSISIVYQEPLVDQSHRLPHQPQTFIHAGNQYTSPVWVPVSPCYSIYLLQNPILDHHHLPVYFVPNVHTQAYILPSNIPSSKPEMGPQFIQVQMLPPTLAQAYVVNTQINQPSSNPTCNYGHSVHVYYHPLPPTQYQAMVVRAENFRTYQPIRL